MKVCKEGKFATKLESNTIYLGKSNDKYHCPAGHCAELGSYARPCKSIKEAFDVLAKRYDATTPVTFSFGCGFYNYDDEAPQDAANQEVQIPSNNVGWTVPIGKIEVRGMDALIKDSDFSIENTKFEGSIRIRDGEEPTALSRNTNTNCPTFKVDETLMCYTIDATNTNDANCRQVDITGCTFGCPIQSTTTGTKNVLPTTFTTKGSVSTNFTGCNFNFDEIAMLAEGNAMSSLAMQGCKGRLSSLKTSATGSSTLRTAIAGSTLTNGENVEELSQQCMMLDHSSTDQATSDHTICDSEITANTAQDFAIIKTKVTDQATLSETHDRTKFTQTGSGGISSHSSSGQGVATGTYFGNTKRIVPVAAAMTANRRNTNCSNWKKQHLSGKSRLHITANDNVTDVGCSTSLTVLSDSAQKMADQLNNTTTSGGKRKDMSDFTKYTGQAQGNKRISGPLGTKNDYVLSGDSQHKATRTDGFDEFTKGEGGDATSSYEVNGNTVVERIDNHVASVMNRENEGVDPMMGDTAPSKQYAERISQNGNSRMSWSRTNCRDECRGLGHIIKILRDSAQNVHTERGQDLTATDLADDQDVFVLEADDDAETIFTGDANTSNVLGGTFIRTIRKGRSKNQTTVTGHKLTHTPKESSQEITTYITELEDDARSENIETGNILKSLGTLKKVELKGNSRLRKTCTNSFEEAVITLHDKRAENDSQLDTRFAGVELRGTKYSRGNVFQILDQTFCVGEFIHETGKAGEKQGQVIATGGSHTGLFRIIEALPFNSNYNQFHNDHGPALDTEDTDQVNRLSKFTTSLDGAAVRSKHSPGKPQVKLTMEASTISSLFSGEIKNYLIDLLGEPPEMLSLGTSTIGHPLVARFLGTDPLAKALCSWYSNLNVGGSTTPGKMKNFILQENSTKVEPVE